MQTKLVLAGFVFSALFYFGTAHHTYAANDTASSSETVAETAYTDTASVEKRVREYFKDVPVMIEIARCESGFRQYTDAGNVLYGGRGGMVGVFQFYEVIHQTAANRLGYDITTLEGNLKYARELYNTEGTSPWQSSFDCWNVTTTDNPAPTTKTLYSGSLKETELQRQIDLLLQIISLLKQIQALQLLLR